MVVGGLGHYYIIIHQNIKICHLNDNDAEQQLTLQIEGLSIENDVGVKIVICATCGKEGEEDSMNICNKCKMVHYCNVTCKKKHNSKHKKKCERRAAELHDKMLFKEHPPPRGECPICMLPHPVNAGETLFKSCCGKTICYGCIHAMVMEEIRRGKKKEERGICAFCRTLRPSSKEEEIERIQKLMGSGNADAYYQLAGNYAQGIKGMPQDWAKANELLLKAGELGCAEAYFRLGYSFSNGMGVEADKKKAKHYYEIAAMRGDVIARYNLGALESKAGNEQRATKHYILAARAGLPESLDKVKKGFIGGVVTKKEYESTLRAYQKSVDEMKSDTRDKAKAEQARRENNG